MKLKVRVFINLALILAVCSSFSVARASEPNPPYPPATATPLPPPPGGEPVAPSGGSREGGPVSPPLPVPGVPNLPGDGNQPVEQLDPPRVPRQMATITTPVKAVVLRSYSGCTSTSVIWDSLNATWSSYGSIPVQIIYDYPTLCSGTITYAALAASGADVLIISDPTGGGQLYSAAEISAIQQYANEGHNLVGTYLVLQFGTTDNRGLAPLFGLQAGLTYTISGVITPTYSFPEPGNPLFKNLAAPYASSGYNESQVPGSGTWSAAALNGARIVGISADSKAAILSYHAPNYVANYITSMPEFGGGTQDKQFFYNALTYDVIDAVVLRSWSGCSSGSLIWDSLNATWPSYGLVPIHIRYAAPGLCSGTITYAALAASGADVLIISDPAGMSQQYSAAEIAAIQQYANEGHNLVGTYLLLQFDTVDNRGLAPLFGLQGGLTYTLSAVTPTYSYLEPGSPLFKNLAAPYLSSGYPNSQVPASGSWSGAALNGARIVGINADSKAAILSYQAPNYVANYITSMPEYGGGAQDKRFFYNAITYNIIDALVIRSWSGCSSGSVIWDSLNATWSSYGSIPVQINYTYPTLCSGTITYAALAASGADVLIISDPAGGGQQYSAAEIAAILQYANEGHNLIGTYAMLQIGTTDNRGLAALFGLQGGLTYTNPAVTPTYNFLEPGNPLFRNLAAPYASLGYPNSQVPASGSWSGAALNGARIVGISADAKAAILLYTTLRYNAIYITSMPEYFGGTQDKQFFYNAIRFLNYRVYLPLILR